MQDGRGAGCPSMGAGGRAAVSLTPDTDRMHIRIFESSQLDGLCMEIYYTLIFIVIFHC